MRSFVEHALSSRPGPPRQEDRWEKVRRIGRDVCEKIPALVDSEQGPWTKLLYITSSLGTRGR